MADYASHFGHNNIPYGIASSKAHSSPQCVTRIGNDIIFLADLADKKLFEHIPAPLASVFRETTLNSFAALGRSVHREVRAILQGTVMDQRDGCSEPVENENLHKPVHIGDFTDFSASKDHVLNASEAITGIRALPPAFQNYPVSYAGRCSSIVVSGTPVSRPLGQFIEDYTAPQKRVIFGPSRALDYELEVGIVIGKPVEPRQRPKASDADEHIFGLVLVNDWSARDIQALEMNPLGPFNGKNFATSISPWVITLDALEGFPVAAPAHTEPVAAFLSDPRSVNYAVNLEVELIRNGTSTTTCKVGFQTMYWTFRHMLAHHAIGGCGLRTGDLIASGTVSGEGDTEHGCLLELSRRRRKPAQLNDGSELRYLEDGDIVRFKGRAGIEADGVGFGECVGAIRSAE
ncbi:fumarylacetoacetate hydrolase FahA [Zopfia rhizophila CBS 207.26]|uniref:Fumarylacetoacetase n=1 Tax=Zopfia rhizophila CBS 207.26 TaxID=1314779 RepID=A0A6A6EMQ6_9PEZI|nr:fumarylacetoacetate hydrolase FahA [Zopfia rhizophila CBS 207.26]